MMLFYSSKYNTDLRAFGIKKPFALDRGELVLEQLRKEFPQGLQVAEPQPISESDALLVHSAEYIASLRDPQIWKEIFELKSDEYNPSAAERPLNELFEDIALKSGGTKAAVELACLGRKPTANLGGGYHHAFPSQGRGFCVLNDIAIAIRSAQRKNLSRRCLIIDVDFHQGDGNALIFSNDPSVFTLSIHSEEGWPEVKQKSDLDIGIRSHETHLYQAKLEEGVSKALADFKPDLVVFVAGSDAYEKDVLAGTAFIKLSLAEMLARDLWVIETIFGQENIPLAMVFAGGYGPDVWEVHLGATRRIVEYSTMSHSSHS